MMTYEQNTSKTSLDLFKGDSIFYAHDLLLHRYRFLQPL